MSEKLSQKGVPTLNKNFFNEFVIEVPNADKFLATLKLAGILGGIQLSETRLLVATTEMTSDEDIEKYIQNV